MIRTFAEILEIYNGRSQKEVENPSGAYPIYGSGGIMGYADRYICPPNTIVLGRKGSINNPIFVDRAFWNVDTAFGLVANQKMLRPKYLYFFCRSYDFEKLNTTVTIPSLTKANLLKISLDLPPLSEQDAAITHLERVERLVFLYQRQLAKFDELVKARFVEMFGGDSIKQLKYPTKQMDEVFEITSSRRILKSEWKESGIPFLRVRDMVQLAMNKTANNEFYVSEEFYSTLKDSDGIPQPGDIMVSATSTLGRCYEVKEGERFYYKDADVLRFRKKTDIDSAFFMYCMKLPVLIDQIEASLGVTTVSHFLITKAKTLIMPIPPRSQQQHFSDFVALVDKSKAAVQKSLDKAQLLFESLMQQYFN